MYQFFPNNTGEAMLHKNSEKKKSIDKIVEDSNKHGWLCPLSVNLKYCSQDL